ncbi:hypothetical protein [Streptomyces sp. NPDC001678]
MTGAVGVTLTGGGVGGEGEGFGEVAIDGMDDPGAVPTPDS